MSNSLKEKVILCLGDSITAGALSSSPQTSYVGRLKQLSGACVVGYGSGGSRISKQTKPSDNPVLDRDFILRSEQMQSSADYVVVFGGTNDFGHGDAPLGTLGDDTPYTFYGALFCLYTQLKSKYPTAKIVAVTPLHRKDEKAPLERGYYLSPLKDYVSAIKKVAEKFSIPVLDLFSNKELNFKQIENSEKYFSGDGLHPNDLGHEIIANELYQFLLKV